MNPSVAASASASVDTLTIERLLQIIWARRGVFIVLLALTIIAVATFAFYATPRYRATIKLMPRQADGGGSQLQSLVGQFGGLASLAGVNMGSSVDEQEALAYLKSRALFETFLNREQLMPVLFSAAWDASRRDWRADVKRIPTRDDAWLLFDRTIRTVNQDTKTRLITLEITWKDREKAAAWANDLVQLANDELRGRALREADGSLESLREQVKQADALELRLSIYQLMQVQINRKVLAKARPDYALTVLDPAFVPDSDKFVSPRRGLLLLICVPLGLFVAAFGAIGLQVAYAVFKTQPGRF